MGCYILSLGGTGARCVKAVIHLCAAGLMPEDRIWIGFVDPDKANGSLEEAQTLLSLYQKCKEELWEMGKTNFFKTGLEVSNPMVWSPFDEIGKVTNLNDLFKYNIIKGKIPEVSYLFEILYTRREREQSLEKGFRGRPSIGAAVISKVIDLEETGFWGEFWTRVKQDVKGGKKTKVFFLASIFGGTGASSFLTLARIIRNKCREMNMNIQLGGAIIMPYFQFPLSNKEDEGEIIARSEEFVENTKAAFSYYYHLLSKEKDLFQIIYPLGSDLFRVFKECKKGGSEQRNKPHFIELYAALSSIDFFSKEKNGQDGRGACGFVGRKPIKGAYFDWNSVPNQREVREKLGQLLRFAFAYLNVYYPALMDIRQRGRGYRSPWFVQMFHREKLFLRQNGMASILNDVRVYSENLLEWLAHVLRATQDKEISLFKLNAIARPSIEDQLELLFPEEMNLHDFSNLILSEEHSTLDRVWKQICSVNNIKHQEVKGIGKFFRALYQFCA